MKKSTSYFLITFSFILICPLVIHALPLSSIYLNSTSPLNSTLGNLTVYTNQDDNSSLDLIYNWTLNSNPFFILYLPFEGGSNSTWTPDYSGHENIQEVFMANWTTGVGDGNTTGSVNRAYYFNNSTAHINSTIQLSAGSLFTVAFWYYATPDVLNSQTILSTDSSAFTFSQLASTGGLDVTIGTNFGPQTLTDDFFSSNGWAHIAFAWNGTNVLLYINGSLTSIGGGSGNIFTTSIVQIAPSLNGSIDEFMIFNRSLSPEQVSLLYNMEYNTISSEELTEGDVWSSCVIGNVDNAITDILCSDNFSITETTPPSITLNDPSGDLNSSSLSILLNVSSSETGSIWYNLNGLGNSSLCDSCTTGTTMINVSEFGLQSITLYANDSSGNLNITSSTFHVFLDTDGDGVNDTDDTDDDGDGIADSSDFLLGNLTNIVANAAGLNLSINGSYNLSQSFTGRLLVNFTRSNGTFLSFYFNFSNGTLSLPSLLLEQQASGASVGLVFVKGLSSYGNLNKTVFLTHINSSLSSVCVKDSDLNSSANITSSCTASDETVVACPGVNGTYQCSIVGDKYAIGGLSHSLVIETFDLPSPSESSESSGSSGGGGGGGGGSAIITSPNCSTTWSCSPWGFCFGGMQNRSCSLLNASCYGGETPLLSRSCLTNESAGLFIDFSFSSFVVHDSTLLTALFDVNSSIHISDSLMHLQVYNSEGGLVFEDSFVGAPSYSFEHIDLADGKYSVRLDVTYLNVTSHFSQSFWVIDSPYSSLLGQDLLFLVISLGLLFIWHLTLFGRCNYEISVFA